MTHLSSVPLQVDSVAAFYPGADSAPTLQDVCLSVHAGQFVAVLGPNGAGKSTLVKVLSGLMSPSHGCVRLFGQDLRQVPRRQVARSVAVVPQQVQVAFDFTVRQVVMMGRAPHQGAMLMASESDQHVVDEVLERTELTVLQNRLTRELSGGEQMRVAIARALAQQPEVLVLDEATAHLDIRHSVAVLALVKREVRDRELACVAVMHDLNEAARNADHVLLLKQGRVRAQGTVPQVMTYRILRETFGVELYVGLNEVDGSRYYVPMREAGA